MEIIKKNIKTYFDLSERIGSIILCNQMETRVLEGVNGDYLCEEHDIFQYFIIEDL